MKFIQSAARSLRYVGQGPEGDWLDDLIDYAESFSPGLAARLVPASGADLAALEAEAGPPPPSYRRFLERMGADPTPLTGQFKARLELGELLELYAETPPEERPQDAYLIGFGVMNVYPELALRHLPNDPQGEPQLVIADGPQVLAPVARSFPRWLLQQTFIHSELEAYPVRQHYGLSRGLHTLERAQRAAVAAGFSPYWFSDGYTCCAWAEGAGVAIHMLQGGTGWIAVGALDAARAARLGEALDAALGLQFQRKLVTPAD